MRSRRLKDVVFGPRPTIAAQSVGTTLTPTTTFVKLAGAASQTTGSYDTANNRWVCPEDGVYSFAGVFELGGTIVDQAAYFALLYKNGASQGNFGGVNTSGAPPVGGGAVFAGSMSLVLKAGDYVEFYGYASSGAAANLKFSNLSVVKVA